MTPVLAIGQPLSTSSAVVSLPKGLPTGRYQVTLSVVGSAGSSLPATLTLVIR